MSYLLDTHTFLFTAFSPEKLSKKALGIVTDIKNDIYVSAITFWEISLKYSIGKIALNSILPEELPDISEGMGFVNLSVSSQTAASYHKIPGTIHKDPFDRMLIWQAVSEKMVLISKDKDIRKYKIHQFKVLW